VSRSAADGSPIASASAISPMRSRTSGRFTGVGSPDLERLRVDQKVGPGQLLPVGHVYAARRACSAQKVGSCTDRRIGTAGVNFSGARAGAVVFVPSPLSV
jgi:hypothetical protein